MYESETQRLQREVDIFTQKFEHEKRRLLILEEQIKQVNAELGDRDKSVKNLKPGYLVEKKSTIKMVSSNKNVNNENVKLNQTKATNLKMRKQIDGLRKELTSANHEVNRIEKTIKRTKREAEGQNKEYVVGKKIYEEANN
jgi:chromosome segregation ATPase